MPLGTEVLDRARTAYAARYALQATNYPGARVNIGPSVAGYLAPNVRPQWLQSFFGRGGSISLEAQSRGGRLPAGQTLGPLGSGFAGIARAPEVSQTPVVLRPIAGEPGAVSGLGGILQHELAHVQQRQNLVTRLGAAGSILAGRTPEEALEPFAYRVAGGQVANTQLGNIPLVMRPFYAALLRAGRRGV